MPISRPPCPTVTWSVRLLVGVHERLQRPSRPQSHAGAEGRGGTTGECREAAVRHPAGAASRPAAAPGRRPEPRAEGQAGAVVSRDCSAAFGLRPARCERGEAHSSEGKGALPMGEDGLACAWAGSLRVGGLARWAGVPRAALLGGCGGAPLPNGNRLPCPAVKGSVRLLMDRARACHWRWPRCGRVSKRVRPRLRLPGGGPSESHAGLPCSTGPQL